MHAAQHGDMTGFGGGGGGGSGNSSGSGKNCTGGGIIRSQSPPPAHQQASPLTPVILISIIFHLSSHIRVFFFSYEFVLRADSN